MGKKLLLLVACIMAMAVARAQTAEADGGTSESFSSHRVMMGETVVLLAKKYKMTPQDIYEYNPDATDGISQGMLIKIPLHRQVNLGKPAAKKESVAAEPQAKAKKPGSATAAKPESKPSYIAAKPEEVITPPEEAPVQPVTPADVPAAAETATPAKVTLEHTVQKGETLYGISQKYGVSVADLKAQNAVLKNGLHVGQTLAIAPVDYTAEGYTPHTVQSGETLFGLSKKYGVSVGQITDANKKTLKNGLKAGQTLKIPAVEATAVTTGTQH